MFTKCFFVTCTRVRAKLVLCLHSSLIMSYCKRDGNLLFKVVYVNECGDENIIGIVIQVYYL